MNIEIFYGFIFGLFYAYVGLMVVLFTMEFADNAIEKHVGDSTLNSLIVLVSWVLSVPVILCHSWFKKILSFYKRKRAGLV